MQSGKNHSSRHTGNNLPTRDGRILELEEEEILKNAKALRA